MGNLELTTKRKRLLIKISNLKQQFRKTDYITDKLTGAIIEYVVNDNKAKAVELYNEYKDILTKRQKCRDEINELETQLEALQAET